MEIIKLQRKLDFTSDDTLEVAVAPNAGACFGVVRAIKLGEQALTKHDQSGDQTPVYSFGQLIHNPKVVKHFEEKGLQVVSTPDGVEVGTVVLRSHGVQKDIEKKLKDKGVHIVDATCPLVKKPQRIAQSLGQKGYFLIIVGDSNHPEVRGVKSYFGSERVLVTYHPEDLAKIPEEETKVGIIAQTTIEVAVLNKVIEGAKARFADVAVYNTICDATSIRQSEAVELAGNAEVVVVVGGKNSSNTCKLVKICEKLQPATHHIEDLVELDPQWFAGKKKIGVTGGASTPHDYVDEVAGKIIQIITGSMPARPVDHEPLALEH